METLVYPQSGCCEVNRGHSAVVSSQLFVTFFQKSIEGRDDENRKTLYLKTMVTNNNDSADDFDAETPIWKLAPSEQLIAAKVMQANASRMQINGISDDVVEPEDVEWVTADRQRGILTTRDRKYIRGGLELDKQAERDLRYRIRQRIKQSIYDIEGISQLYDQDEIDTIFKNLGPSNVHLAKEICSFGLRCCQAISNNSEGLSESDLFEKIISSAIKSSFRWSSSETVGSALVNIDFEIIEFSQPELKERILNGKASRAEFDKYRNHGSIRTLIAEAEERGLEEIRVDDMGINAVYELDELKEQQSELRDSSISLQSLIDDFEQ
ncbi:hypothetical protein [Haloplanus rubicundus]|uniref:hypothetical protein n=1 Tax=Haloplanus rubicundus TaxID=1547898 RepID=UPI0013006485|nr:hypothetical protein [Haloplanus rubicundus]